MSLGKKPTVFVSSTCYDLKQIRADIKYFLEEQLGFEALLSEYNSFPLDPNAGTIDNCLRAVDERADIFILIVGARYGSVVESGHSVTNMEYLKAKAKGIPIYAFVDKSILSVLPLWRDNPSGNFQSTVDTPKLFEFVDTFRGSDRIWSFGFETAQNIIDILKVQLSYFFSDCLSLRQKTVKRQMSKKVLGLEGSAFKIIVLRPAGWEYKLFGQVLSDGLAELLDRRRDFNFGITLAIGKQLKTFSELMDYIVLKIDQLQTAMDVSTTIINKTLPDAFGEPGIAGNEDYIIYVANRLVEVYNSIIDWSLDFAAIGTENEFTGLVNSFSKMCEGTLEDIEKFSKEYCEMVESIPDNLPENAEPISLNITLKLSPPNTDEYYQELSKLQQKYGIEPEER